MLVLLAPTAAWASDQPFAVSPPDDALVRHPLNTPEAWALRGDMSADEAWANIHWRDGVAEQQTGRPTISLTERSNFTPYRPPPRGTKQVDLDVQEALARAAGSEVIHLVVSTDRRAWMPFPSVTWVEQVAMLDERATTHGDLRRVRADAFQRWRDASESASHRLRERVQQLDGTILDESWLSGQITVALTADAAASLLADDDVFSVELWHPDMPTSEGHTMVIPGPYIDGVERSDMLQVEQFYNAGYEGEGFILVTEPGSSDVFRSHPGFNDGSGSTRYLNCRAFNALGGHCSGNGNPGWSPLDPAGPHATATAAIVLGDVTRGQDPLLTTAHQRRARSGVARTALGIGSKGSIIRDQIIASSIYQPRILNASFHSGPDNCIGRSQHARDQNGIFEAGVAIFKSAGNQYKRGVNCSISNPGAAIGVFTVGAYEVLPIDVAALYHGTGRLMNVVDRTLVDIIAPSNHAYAYPHYMWPTDGSGVSYRYGLDFSTVQLPKPHPYNATSSAAPAATGTAALIRQWWHDEYGATIDDPATLYTAMLLMGDGWTQVGTNTTGYSPVSGAGRLRARRFSSDGLEAPMAFGYGSICLGHGYTSTISLTSTAASVDTLRVVTWQYDGTHDTGGQHALVDLELFRRNALNQWVSAALDHSDDNKKRVQVNPPFSTEWAMTLTGRDVQTDVEGCGNNATRVHYAWFAESNDRPAGGGLEDVRP